MSFELTESLAQKWSPSPYFTFKYVCPKVSSKVPRLEMVSEVCGMEGRKGQKWPKSACPWAQLEGRLFPTKVTILYPMA